MFDHDHFYYVASSVEGSLTNWADILTVNQYYHTKYLVTPKLPRTSGVLVSHFSVHFSINALNYQST